MSMMQIGMRNTLAAESLNAEANVVAIIQSVLGSMDQHQSGGKRELKRNERENAVL